MRVRSAAKACSCRGLDVQGSDRNPGVSRRLLLLWGDEDAVVVRLRGVFRRTVDASRWRDARWEGNADIEVFVLDFVFQAIELFMSTDSQFRHEEMHRPGPHTLGLRNHLSITPC